MTAWRKDAPRSPMKPAHLWRCAERRNKIPLCAGTVQKVTDRLTALDFDRLYDNCCL
jgi:hypothetical protein